MFDSLFRYGEKRRTVSIMVIVKEVRFQKNGYFIPRSIYCLYQEKDPSQRITSCNNLMTLSDTKVIPINDTLKFHASLFESKSDSKLVDKKRRIMLRQVSIIDEQEAYRDIAYFDLQLDSLVQGPRCVHCSFDLVDEQQLMSGQVEVTLRYRFRDSEVASPSSSSNSLLLRKQSSSMRSFRSESSYFEDWSDDEAKEEGEREGGISSSVSGQQQQQSQHHSTMSRQISGQFELPSLNRVNSVAPPRSAVVEVSTAAAPPSFSSSNPNVGRPLPTPSLQRKVTNENISSFCFTSEGVPVDSRELPPSLPNRYGPSLTQPHQSNASMLSTDSTGNNNKKNEEQRGVSSSSPQVGISHAQLAERSTLSMESLHSSNSSRGGGGAVKLLARSTSVNSIRSLGTAKSNSVKSVRFDDDVMFGGAAVGSGGGKQRGAGGPAAVLTEEEEFGVTFDELEEFYQ